MKREQKRGVIFIGKSMLWSLMLYICLMLACNWDEVSNAFSGNHAITKVSVEKLKPVSPESNPEGQQQPNISQHTGVISIALNLVKIVVGIAVISDKN